MSPNIIVRRQLFLSAPMTSRPPHEFQIELLVQIRDVACGEVRLLFV